MEQLDMFGGDSDLIRFACESKWAAILAIRIEKPRLYEPMIALCAHGRGLRKAMDTLEKALEWEDRHRRALRAKRYHAFYVGKALHEIRQAS